MLKLISLNMERSNHLKHNLPFLAAEQPDILCLQEVFEADIEQIAKISSMPFYFWQKNTFVSKEKSGAATGGYSGLAMFSHTPFLTSGNEYYSMPHGGITLEKTWETYHLTNAYGILWATINKDDHDYQIATTHFTWSHGGLFDQNQKTDFKKLKTILDRLGPHILTGDLNAPRGQGLWEKFVAYYGYDPIPAEVRSTIDPKLHRRSGLQVVVDAIFATPPYETKTLSLRDGVSDHQALIAMIEKVI